jgi:predicted amino acid racemase
MNKLIINLDQIAINARFAKGLASASGYELVGVLKAVQCHPRIISTLVNVGVERFAFSSAASVAALLPCDRPDREVCLLLGPSAPDAADQTVAYFSSSIQSSLAAIEALAVASRAHALSHGIFIALRTFDDREGVDTNDLDTIIQLARAVLANGLRFEGLACNLGCTTLEPMRPDFIDRVTFIRAQVEADLGQEIALSLGGSFLLPDLPSLPGALSLRVGELLLSGTEPAGRNLATCATGFALQACIVEVTNDPTRILVDVGSAILEKDAFEICLPNAKTLSMSGEFMVITADFPAYPQVGAIVQLNLGYNSLKKALIFPFLDREWLDPL